MASSGNFCVFSTVTRPESGYSTTDQISGGGLSIKGPSSGSFEPCIATFTPDSGKWYWEYRTGQGGSSVYGRPSIAVHQANDIKDEDYYGGESGAIGVLFQTNDGNKRSNNSTTSYGNAVSQNDIVQMALDCDNGAMYFGINNTWQNSGDPTSGASKTGAALSTGIQNVPIDIIHGRYNGGGVDQYNFGQDGSFAGAITDAGNADENGFGTFKYSPPSGYLALCAANLPISADIDPGGDDGETQNPTKQFNAVTYTGNGGTQSIDCGLAPDLVWIKNRGTANSHLLFDSSRGADKAFSSDKNNGETTAYSTIFTGFTSTGFNLGAADAGANNSTNNYIAWTWHCNGGTTATNTSGTITTTVQANQAAGFSIVTYAGNNGSWGSTHQDTIGHGLSSAPEFAIFKERNVTDAWTVFHHSVGAGGGTTAAHNNLRLDVADALYTNQSYKSFGGVMPTSTVMTVEGNTTNESTSTHVAYMWHSVDGMQRFGFYEGNGNTDGAFVYTGFRPRMVFFKQIDGAAEWACYDTARDTFNMANKCLEWDLSAAEKTSSDLSTDGFDFLANGFKFRGGGGGRTNQTGKTYIYGAWGDVPLKYSSSF